ncbi:hypothetical protein [Agromyces sp. Marseille-P2726]|uniref:hypothetical protein n=1 Tax=Agromyces sp. Marseille-P2726 TaxID=2709132 RepID=UPI00156E9DE3|nr:hypothetical protein [Agromyces sp. Marseille-P2726]
MPGARLARTLALAIGLTVAGAVLAACSASPGDSEASPDRLTVSIKQGRLDVVNRRLVVRFENSGDGPVTVTRFDVRTPTFAEPLERTNPVELAAHDALDVRLDLPASDCDAEPAPVVVTVEYPTDAGSRTAELVADDPFEVVEYVSSADCLAESVADVATIVMPEHLRSTGAGVDRRAFIDVAIEPAASARSQDDDDDGSASMHLERVWGTTLLNAEDGTDWPLGLDIVAGADPFVVSLAVRPARCDAHGIADDKRGTILPFEIETGDGRAGRLDMPAGDTLKNELYGYYTERCGL